MRDPSIDANNKTAWGLGATLDILPVRQFIWTYVLPVLCLFGLVTNWINFVVFSERKTLKNSIYRYLQWHSIVDILYFALCFLHYVIKWEIFRSVLTDFWARAFEAFAYSFLASSLAIMMILIELIISIKRLLIIMNVTVNLKLNFAVIVAACSVIAVVGYLPLTLSLDIVEHKNCLLSRENIKCMNTTVSPALADIHREGVYVYIFKRIHLAVTVFRGFIAPVLLLFLNLVIAIKFRQLCIRKSHLKSNHRTQPNNATTCNSSLVVNSQIGFHNNSSNQIAELNTNVAMCEAKRNLTQMIIIVNILFIISNMSACLSFFSFLALGLAAFTTNLLFIVTNIVLFITHGSCFFIYLKYDKLFRQVFKAFLNRTFLSNNQSNSKHTFL